MGHHHDIGRLIHFGLSIRADPVQEPEYAELLHRFENETEFRLALRDVALGLGLEIADATQFGLVFVPTEDSLFRLRPAEVRNSTGRDDRLIEGFIHLGIAASAFPRPELLDDPEASAHPVTVTEVEERLRQICDRFEAEVKQQPDPEVSEVEQELIAAWRIYQRRAAEGNPKKRVGPATRVMIEKMLETLADQGMFIRRRRTRELAYQPTFRYHTQVRELQAARVFQRVQDLVEQTGSAFDLSV
jgi:hypothetical protein